MNDYILNFFGLDPNRAGEGAIRFGAPWPGFVTILVVAGLFFLFRHLYRTEQAKASVRYRRTLLALRCMSALVLIVMLFRPIHVVENVDQRESYVAVLVDRSLSMTLKDNYGPESKSALSQALSEEGGQDVDVSSLSRLELVSRALNHRGMNLLEKLGESAELRAFTFGSDVSTMAINSDAPVDEGSAAGGPPTPKYELKADGDTTRLGDAIAKVSDSLRGQRLSAMVLITDGQSNLGVDAEEAALEHAARRVPTFPILAVSVGSPESAKDLEVLQVLAKDAVFVNDDVVFSVLVKNQGYEQSDVAIQLKQGDEVVEEATITLPESGKSHDFKIRYRPRTIGQFTFEVSLESQASERITENNSRKHAMRVVDARVKVLFVSGVPGWEYRYLKNSLIRDHSVEVSTLLQSSDSDFVQDGDKRITRFPKNKSELYDYDVIIFSDVNFREFDDDQMEAMVGFVEDLGGGIFFQAGPHHQLHTLVDTPLGKLLPVIPNDLGILRRGPVSESFLPRVTREGVGHSILAIESEADKNQARWLELPGFYWYLPIQRVRSGAQILLEHPYEKGEGNNHPVLAVQIYGAGRTAFMASPSTWRWRHIYADLYFYRFWGQTVRYLSTGRLLGQSRRVMLLTDKSSYQLGDEVSLSARLLDELYRPLLVDKAEVQISFDDKQETVVLKPEPRQPGMYKGAFSPFYSGQHTAMLESNEDEAVSRTFVVRHPSLEFDVPETNEPLLKRLTEMTNGEFFTLSEIGNVPGRIAQFEDSIVSEEEDELWDSPFFLLLLSGLLVVEWVLRKRRMMI